MDGMIFAAGLGTRLRPLTDDRPKALVELNGKSLLEHVILKMKEAGVGRVVVNVHHYAGMIENFLASRNNFGMDVVVSDERDGLLDTGGGLLKAARLFRRGEPVLVHNVDILSDLCLNELFEAHEAARNYVTLVTRPSQGERVLKFDTEGIFRGWENKQTGEQKIVDKNFFRSKDYSFCGIQIISPDFLENFVYSGVFSIIDEYIARAKSKTLRMYPYAGRFMDLGTPEAIAEAARW